MKQVFAVFLCFLFLSGCTKPYDSKGEIKNQNVNASYEQNILYSIAGDFDEDTYPEYMYLIKTKDNLLFLKMLDGSESFSRKLSIKLTNYCADVVDVNNDKKDEYVLYDTNNNVQNLYVFSFNSKELCQIFNPGTIQHKVTLTKIKTGYLIKCGQYKKVIKSTNNLSLNLNYNDMDYDGDSPTFESIGTITLPNNKILYTLSVQFLFDINNNIIIKDFNLLPYSEPKPE